MSCMCLCYCFPPPPFFFPSKLNEIEANIEYFTDCCGRERERECVCVCACVKCRLLSIDDTDCCSTIVTDSKHQSLAYHSSHIRQSWLLRSLKTSLPRDKNKECIMMPGTLTHIRTSNRMERQDTREH